ncbi:MAG: Ig-like domain-containing protein [Sinobacteraceae bacterium]|nr:Ig-like domain-containing protein [Nevskiaceae bacterium]MCP5470644.1 Ig-like domain-containing protein [Nevskiaceae bacterium]
MRKISSLLLIWAAGLLTACGGGSDNDVFRPGTPGGAVPPNVATVTVTTSKASILSDGSESAVIIAYVRDSSNRLLTGVPVTFASSSGGISPPNATTGDEGTATATLVTAGDSSLRTITVTANAGSASGTVTVQVVAAQPPVTVGSLTLTTSTPTLPSDGSNPATITALVQDTSNRYLAGVPVVFTTTSGGLTINESSTTASGIATATLSTPGNKTNRTITVTAAAGGLTRTVDINVVGSQLLFQGADALVLGATSPYTVRLVDSANNGIPSTALTVSSANGNTLSASSLTTDGTGTATFNVTVTANGNDTLTVSGLGLTANHPVSVNSDSFAFVTPADLAEVPLNTPTSITVRWMQGSNPVSGQQVTVNSTRGTITGSPATTNGSGEATVTIISTNAGIANITANAGSASAQRSVEFVAMAAASIDAQASTATVGIGEQSTITAVVRDAAGNLVKNKTVNFSLTDVSGGTLSLASATTNSQGRAQTVYTAGSSVSGFDEVQITASVADSPGVTPSTVRLTVARKEVFISLGTGNTIEEPNEAQYRIRFQISVTDANGNGVANVPVTTSVLTERYLKGRRRFDSTWANYEAPVYVCQDEDTLVPASARNGVLDPGEDVNGNDRLDVGNIALVSPAQAMTNAQGFVIVDVLYPQDTAYWADVTLEARAGVQGTEFRRSSTFRLPGSTTDFSSATVAPPGPVSPFGTNDCTTPN